jgi:TPR repeat protein
VPKNLPEAFRWYDRAAKKGAVDAQINLGRLYYEGKGTKRDRIMAFVWFKLAASQNSNNSQKNATFTFKQLSKKDQQQALALTEEYRKKFQ